LLSEALDLADKHLAEAREILPANPPRSLVVEADALEVDIALASNDLETVQTRAGPTERAAAALGRFELSCQMLQAQGRAAFFSGDFDEAQRAFQRMEETARKATLAVQRMRALTELGTLKGLSTADTTRLVEARQMAVDTGSVSSLARIDLEIAWVKWGMAETNDATTAVENAVDISRQFGLRLLPTALVAQASLHALAGKRNRMERAITEASNLAPDEAQVIAGVHGNGRAVLNLLEGNREAALVELTIASQILKRAVGRPWWFQGLGALLETVRGTEPDDHLPATSLGEPANRAFRNYAKAVVLGREGDADEAERMFALGDVLMPPGWRRHYARILVAESAADNGWGEPGPWAQEAMTFFQNADLAGLATQAKATMRKTGIPVPRRTAKEADLPAPLGSIGVTSREMEVLQLVALGLSNQEIGGRLFLSPRTVESHVTSLMRKTRSQTRPQLVAFAGLHTS
jgi:DNA-binding CsgD family transcriptional regulator